MLPRAAGEPRRTALVSGEPGSGKSRLVRELAGSVAQEGAIVLYGGCDAVVKTPYGAFVEALGPLERAPDATALLATLGPRAGDVGWLLPGLVGESVAPPSGEPDADAARHRLHVAAAELCAAVGAIAPVLVVLEDLHWADVSTLLLVRHLARTAASARMLLVGTFRDAEADVPAPLAETLAELARSEAVRRVRLTGLDRSEIAEFVRLAAGAEPDPAVTDELSGLTDGNPFLLTELWRQLVDADAAEVDDDGRVRLVRALEVETPETVREVVAQRIVSLEPETRNVLELGAVAGSTFDLDLVRRAAGLDEAALLDAIDDAVRSGFLVESPGLGLAYRFAHELVRRSVVDRVSTRRRSELHLAVAEALEHSPAGAGTRSRLDALAHHYAEAAPLGDRRRAVDVNLLAAERASASLAFDEAVVRIRTALELGIDDPVRRGTVMLELGYGCHRAGRSLEALDAFRAAAEAARALDDAELLARAAIGFEEACWRPAIHDEGAVELLEEAATAVGPEPSEIRVRLLGALTRALDFVGDYPRARPARDEAIAMARRLGDTAALGWVLSSAYWARGSRPDAEIFEMLSEAYAIGEDLDDDLIRAEALWWLVPSHVSLADHVSARRALTDLFELAVHLGEPFRLHVAEHYASALALCDGDLELAEAAAERSREWSHLLRGRNPSGVYGIQMFGIRREQGRLSELAPALRVLMSRERASGAWPPALVVLLADLGMHDELDAELDRILAEGLGSVGKRLWLATLAYVTEAAVAVGHEALVAELYEALTPHAGSNVQIGHLVACLGSADRFLGMLAGTMGEWDRAEEHLQAARELNESLGARTWLAHTLVEHARILQARRSRDDRRRAPELLAQALAIADEHGLRSVAARARALGASRSAPRLPDGLSPREVEILRLVALGLSNRELGARLHISEHTAANHVRSILRKTGCTNRTEATTYAHRHHLLPS